MRLTATFILLTFATYVRAAQCVPCPCTVAGENISFICGAVNKDGEPETRCLYYANFDHAPLCAYFSAGESMGFSDYSTSDSNCPYYVGTTLSGCETC